MTRGIRKPWGSYPSDLRDRRRYKSCRKCGATEGIRLGFCSDTCRLLHRVQQQADGCWLWIGAVSDTGYGSFVMGGRPRGAHRASYQLFVGPIPDGLVLDHLCRNRACVNPEHLEPVTGYVNVVARGFSPGAIAVRTNRCKRDHEFTPANTYVRRDTGARQCRECRRLRRAAA